jgi:hypothetical protein
MTRVEFVEKALIGSLLNDSARRDDVPWLRADDFTNPLCRAIWLHLESGNPPACQPLVDLVGMSEVLGRGSELHPRLRSPAELATLKFLAPEKPAVVEYGRMLVEATIRREVAAMGLRLESLTKGEPEQILEDVANALASLEGLDQRWQVSVGQRTEVDPDLRHVSTFLTAEGYSQTSAPRSVSAAATTDGMDHRMAENAVIGAAVHDWPRGARAQVLGTVRDCDFTDPRAAATWHSVAYLAEHDAPIDEITVAWQAVRVCGQADDGLTLQELRETRGAALFHEVGAASLARSTLARVVSQAQLATSRCAEDLGVELATVIDSVATHHVAAAAAAQRLSGDFCLNESLTSIKKRLLDRTRRPPVASDTARAIGQRPSSYPVDPSRSQVSP